ncbi:MAG: bifunctional adenosylcobinamide kinase/adenosylcobinamide-phosphate guanylyltransferase [Lachnospiraceae bacterium]|nr:bifunctional adenosylcobinamide kinase/adenosylcobinamide-phosphate guanylyltransferase [Lachnospiraceae bacterium]
MDFIIGGCYQGKKEYAKSQYNLHENDFISAADLKDNDMQGKCCLMDFHLYVRQLMESGQNIEENVSGLFQKNDIRVIISNEVGYGIVPVDASERAYREAVGRASCILAGKADKVVRVVSGIGVVIKQ